jgi:LPXTG-motif cell wall-anchored protein
MNHKRSELYLAAVGASVLFLVLTALALASTTWAAPGMQGTVGQPHTATPKATATRHGGGGCSDCAPTTVPTTPTPTPLPHLPTTGGDMGNGIGLFGISVLLVLGAGLAWQGLRLARR